MWNSVIALDKISDDFDEDLALTVVRIRHSSCDAIMIAAAVLEFVSSKYNIDEVLCYASDSLLRPKSLPKLTFHLFACFRKISILKFYTTTGRKYMAIDDLEHATVCFTKAMEFQESALKAQDGKRPRNRVLSKAVFDLLLGRAECSWARDETSYAEKLVTEASQYLSELAEETSRLANIQYNFGVYSYRAKEVDKAIEWLQKSMETRESRSDGKIDTQKQATSARLIGVCYLARNNLDDAYAMLGKAEALHHDSVGAYLLLKISVSKRDQCAVEQMMSIIGDTESSLDLCLGSIALIADAQWQAHAVNGFKAVNERFESDSSAILERIAPRYFEALTAVGKAVDALHLLERVIARLVKLRDGDEDDERNNTPRGIAPHFQRWSSIALAAGCRLAERKDHAFATIVLDKALTIAHDGRKLGDDETKDPVLENEAAVCRLLASCAILHVSSKSSNLSEGEEGKADESKGKANPISSPTRDETIAFAKRYALRAQELEPDDSSACLLLFRAHLLENRPDLAAEEIRKASSNNTLIDAAGIAEAASYAQDNGDTDAVLAALGCILNLPDAALRKNLVESSITPQPGFFVRILVSYVKILLKGVQTTNEVDDDSFEPNDFCPSLESIPLFHKSLKAGVRGINELGVDVAFGENEETKEESLKFLADVSWNCGKFVGDRDMYDLWESFFDLAYDLNTLRRKSAESLETMRFARLLSAMALAESGTKERTDFVKANDRLMDAKRITDELSIEDDSFPAKILLIQARCLIGMGAYDELGYCADSVCQNKSISVEDMQQLVMIYRGESVVDTAADTSESKARRNEMASSLLNSIVDRLLVVDEPDIADLALTLRELIRTELARGELGNRAVLAFSRAVGVLTENKGKYPSEEVRWLAATAWDRAGMLFMANRQSEAMHWADMAMEVAATDKALQTYVPRIQQIKDKVGRASITKNKSQQSTPRNVQVPVNSTTENNNPQQDEEQKPNQKQ